MLTTGSNFTFGAMAKALNRPPVVISGLQARFELPVLEGSHYTEPYVSFLRTVLYLRAFGIAEERLVRLWHLEKKLLELLHVDTTGSQLWYLDYCGATDGHESRLLLSNYDLEVTLPWSIFSATPRELFAGREIGEDALRVLNEIIPLQTGILTDVAAELPHLREAVRWGTRLVRQ